MMTRRNMTMVPVLALAVLFLVVPQTAAARGSHEPLLETWDFDMQTMNGRYSMVVKWRGEIELSEDLRDVVGLPGDARLYVRETVGFTTAELLFQQSGNSGVQRRLWVNGVERDGQPADNLIVSDLLERVAVDYGVGGVARMERAFAADGIDGALGVVEPVQPGSVKAHLLVTFATNHALSPAESVRWAAATTGIRSSGDLSQTLASLGSLLAPGNEVTVALLNAVTVVASSSDASHAVLSIAATRGLQSASAVAAARVAGELRSSSDQRDVLVALAPYAAGDSSVTAAILDAARTIRAGSDLRDVLVELLGSGIGAADRSSVLGVAVLIPSSSDKLEVARVAATFLGEGNEEWEAIIDLAREIESSSDRLEAVRALNSRPVPAAIAENYFNLIGSIPSSGDRRDALVDALDKQAFDARALVLLARQIEDVPASSDQAACVVALLRYVETHRATVGGSEELRESIRSVIETMPAQSDREMCYDEFRSVFR